MSTLKTQFAARAAKTLRVNMTDAERLLWSHLRDRRLLGFKFVRQLPVGRYIADFACREADLIVELDGGQHAEAERDVVRTRALAQHGYDVVRFWNDEVLTNLDGVLQVLADRLSKAPSPGRRFAKPDLSPQGRGGALASTVPSSPLPWGERSAAQQPGEGAFHRASESAKGTTK